MKQNALMFATLLIGALVGILMGWQIRDHGADERMDAEAKRHTHIADSLTTLAATWKARADSAHMQAIMFMAVADSLAQQDTVTIEWYLNERKHLPTRDALDVKRILLWRNERPK